VGTTTEVVVLEVAGAGATVCSVEGLTIRVVEGAAIDVLLMLLLLLLLLLLAAWKN
jgi:hypothetical protein